MSNSVQPHRREPIRLPCPWDSPGKNTGVGCHFLLQCMKVKSESEVSQSCPTLSDPKDCSLPGSSIHGIFQARVLDGLNNKHYFLLFRRLGNPLSPSLTADLFRDISCASPREGNGTPLQYSCLENPMDGGAWWAACSPWGR